MTARPAEPTSRLELALRELVQALREELAPAAKPPVDRLLSIGETAASLGLGRTATMALLASGTLPSLKVGRRRLVAAGALRAFIAGQAER